MRIRFLGTGTSAGVPVIACDCSVCTSTDPRDTRTRTSASVEFVDATGQERVILIDASPDLREQVLREGMTRVDAILITHNHVDHVWGLDEIRRFNEVMRQPIEVWADAHTHGSLRRVYQHIFEKEKNIQKSFIADLVPRELEVGVEVDLFGMRVTPMTLMHGVQEILGFRFEAGEGVADPGGVLPLAYCTDVVEVPEASRAYLEGADGGVETLVLDALRHRPHSTHFTVQQAVEEAQRVGASRTYFVHMTHDLGHATTNMELPEGVELAYDGLVVGDGAVSS
ncbi:MAG: MBL fold metallo-hydrolase [Phycisphaerales bacterium]|nr:MBL fold metallo-hydrolase [Phycisphaerales bacterium]